MNIVGRSVGVGVKDISFGPGNLGFNSQAGQIGHNVATATTFFRSCVAQALSRVDGPATRYTLRLNTASIIKI